MRSTHQQEDLAFVRPYTVRYFGHGVRVRYGAVGSVRQYRGYERPSVKENMLHEFECVYIIHLQRG